MTEVKLSGTGTQEKYLELIRDFIHSKYGIHISGKKTFTLQSKLDKLLRTSGIPDLKELYRLLEKGDHETELLLVKHITTNYTFFFREPANLEFIAEDIIMKGYKQVDIWCAAASTGEEVYSLVIILLEKGIRDFRLIASDIDRSVLVTMKKGLYSSDKLAALDPNIVKKYFEKDLGRDLYRVRDICRGYIIAKQLNLVHNLRFEGKFRYILCRNVLIYFDSVMRKMAIQNIIQNLEQDGLLIVGQSESLLGMEKNIKQVRASVYTRRDSDGK